jgi:hypothetical protein
MGPSLNRAIMLICLLSVGIRAAAAARGCQIARADTPAWHQRGPESFGRTAMVAKFRDLAGRQLIIVRYSSKHEIFNEWVYNDADIDNSKLVWAREMSPAENAQLVDYFKDRRIWLLKADEHPPKLEPWRRQ